MNNIPDPSSFGKFVPGFDFLQNLAKQATGGAAQSIPQLPNLGNWVAPTFNVEELDKRIDELKTVQFWLDQNATALKATIQALEVQKMTLATLKSMNFNVGDVANIFKTKTTDSQTSDAQNVTENVTDKPSDTAPGLVDTMQWWDSLTKQFGEIAASAMKDAAKQAATDVTQSVTSNVTKGSIKKATDMTAAVNKTANMAKSAIKPIATKPTDAKSASARTAVKKAAAKKSFR